MIAAGPIYSTGQGGDAAFPSLFANSWAGPCWFHRCPSLASNQSQDVVDID